MNELMWIWQDCNTTHIIFPQGFKTEYFPLPRSAVTNEIQESVNPHLRADYNTPTKKGKLILLQRCEGYTKCRSPNDKWEFSDSC